jgi:predicted NACHT family NTPase
LREVAETPLLLKMLCEVFDPQTRQIPRSKGELFRAFDQKYHQHKQNPPVSGDFRRFQSEVLQHLAFEMVRGDDEKPTEAWLTIARSKAEGF